VVEGAEILEDEARRRAVQCYNARPLYDRDGKQIGEIRDYSDGLLTMLLKAKNPRVFNPPPPERTTNVVYKLPTLDDVRGRMERLGLPVPFLEGDFDVIDDDATRN
jgi:hypothetical protein